MALVSLDGVVLSRMVSVSASVNLPLHHKVQKFSSGTGSPRWSRKKGRKINGCGGGGTSRTERHRTVVYERPMQSLQMHSMTLVAVHNVDFITYFTREQQIILVNTLKYT